MKKRYGIKRCSEANIIDANWEKPFWGEIEPANVILSHWPVQSEHVPRTEVKLQYDADKIYVIFRVHDCYVRAVASQINGEVWKDSCVEFFLAPNPDNSNVYFSVEINCCGILLVQYHNGLRENSHFLDVEDCHRIETASSASGPIRNEIAKPLIWTLEYALPVKILSKYSDMQKPDPGVLWHGNFYKCADNSSHPHWMTWSKIDTDFPDFHRPEFFGILEFN